MTKMRESTGVVLWILVLAFGGLWVLQDSGAFDNIGLRQRENIAVVDGEPISYREYTEALESELRAYQQRSGEPASQAVRDQYADLIYDRLVENKLREREMDRLGIRVSDSEVRDMVLGNNPDPLLLQLFPDGQGGVDRVRVASLFEDPETFRATFGIEPVDFENYLRSKRRAEKLEALLSAAIRVTEAEVEAEYAHRTTTAAADYVALRYAAVPDEEITVSDDDLEDYYDEYREDFRRDRTATLRYVALSQEPSPEDSAAVIGDLAELREPFARAEDDSAFVASRFSETPYSSEYVGAGDLEPDVAAAVFESPEVGRVVGPLLVGTEARLVKITGVRPAESPAVRARHILIGQANDPAEQRPQQLERAQELRQQIQSGEITFEEAARQYSQDPGSARRDGDL
ncbi:MAG: SurA N-terminal domain-containing protein, partial [Rhodothermales bacterium]|nr:SurA N-terminal domain-containing protein [Rhodothermales bacterium]